MELLHRIIQKGLICFKNEKKKGYNIDYSLSEIIKIKNNAIFRAIKSTTNNIFPKNMINKTLQNLKTNV